MILLAGLSWPFLYAVKLGQVGPLLFLTFARRVALARPAASAGRSGRPRRRRSRCSPGLVLVWAAADAPLAGGRDRGGGRSSCSRLLGARLRRRHGAWSDFLLLIAPRQRPDHHAPQLHAGRGALPAGRAARHGEPCSSGSRRRWWSCIFAVAALRLPAAPSYLVAVIASQLLSPILWDHYAMLLLLPVAWLLDRGRWWAALASRWRPRCCSSAWCRPPSIRWRSGSALWRWWPRVERMRRDAQDPQPGEPSTV